MKHLFFIALCAVTSLWSYDDDLPRINNLMPGYAIVPPIEPAVPADYIAQEVDYALFWGPQSTFENDLIDTNGLFCIREALTVRQEGKKLKGTFVDKNINAKVVFSKWGDLPIAYTSYEQDGSRINKLWVGANRPEGTVFTILHKTDLSEAQSEIWNQFVNHTVQLNEFDFIRSTGQNLLDGRTVVTSIEGKAEFIAEKRSDGALLLVARPLNDYTSVELIEMNSGLIALKFAYGKLALKIKARIDSQGPKYNVVNESVFTVLPKEVKKFSLDPMLLLREKNTSTYLLKASPAEMAAFDNEKSKITAEKPNVASQEFESPTQNIVRNKVNSKNQKIIFYENGIYTLSMKGFPEGQPLDIYISRLGEKDTFKKIDSVVYVAGSNDNYPLINKKCYLGERISYRIQNGDEILAEDSYIPKPLGTAGKKGKFFVHAELLCKEPTMYVLKFSADDLSQNIKFTSISGKEKISNTNPMCTHIYMPGVKGKDGGVSKCSFETKDDLAVMTFDWGKELDFQHLDEMAHHLEKKKT